MNAMQAGRRAGDDARTAERSRRAPSGAPPTERKPPAGGRPAAEPAASGAPRPPVTERAERAAVKATDTEPKTAKTAGPGSTAAKPVERRSRAAVPTITDPAAAKPTLTDPAAAKPTDSRRRALGRYGEDLATRRLIEAGMRILDRNWRCCDGEIDIVAADGDALVICEVKTRRAGWYEHPMAAVRPEKTARLRLLAERWLEQHGGPPPGGVRIDVIGVLLPARGAPVVQHARGVA